MIKIFARFRDIFSNIAIENDCVSLRRNRIRSRHQISLLILSEFKRINQLLFPLKSPENQRFSDDFRGDKSKLIPSKSFNIRSKFWRGSILTTYFFWSSADIDKLSHKCFRRMYDMWYNFLKNIPSDPNFLLLAFLFGLACNLIKPVDRPGVPTWGATANKRTGLAPGDAVNIKGKRTADIVAVFAKNISQAKMRTIVIQITYVLV